MTLRSTVAFTFAVARKELAALWTSPLPYVLGAAFQAVLGVLMVDQLQGREQAVLQPLFPLAGFLLLFVMPLLTMRTVADEARTGSLDLLLAVPVRPGPLVAGKWLATWLTALAVLAPAGVLLALLHAWGQPDTGAAVAGFVGLGLLAGAVGAVGVLTSSLTSAQAVAALAAVFGALVLWFSHVGSETLSVGPTLAAFSLSERLRAFASGGVDTADVAFFAAMAATALALAAGALHARRLR